MEPAAAEGLGGRLPRRGSSPSSRCCRASRSRPSSRRRPARRASASSTTRTAVGGHVVDTLARLQPRALSGVQLVPRRVPLADRDRAVGLGEAVDVVDLEAERLGPLRSRRAAAARPRSSRCTGRSSWCAAPSAPSITSTVGAPHRCVTPLLVEQPPDERRVDLAAGRRASRAAAVTRPGEAPAVAVEHRQRPEVDRARVEPGVRDLARARSGTRRGG